MALVAIASISAASYPFVAKWCYQCTRATNFLLPYADRLGLVYYVLLCVALWRFGVNKFATAAVCFAAGVHVALMAKLLALHLVCVPCIVCAVSIGCATLFAIGRDTRAFAVTVLAGVIVIGVTSYGYQKFQTSNEERHTKEAIGFPNLDLKSTTSLPIYVYLEPGCHTCQEFSDLYTPRMISKYGDKISLHTMQAPGSINVPTVVVGGEPPVMFIHKPEWFELTQAIEKRFASKPAQVPAQLTTAHSN